MNCFHVSFFYSHSEKLQYIHKQINFTLMQILSTIFSELSTIRRIKGQDNIVNSEKKKMIG